MASPMGWSCPAGSSRLHPGRDTHPRRSAGPEGRLEDVGDDHASAAARTYWVWIGRPVRGGRLRSHHNGEKLASAGDVGLAAGTGKQTIVADAVETCRQDMQQKTPNKLVGMERHDAIALVASAAKSL